MNLVIISGAEATGKTFIGQEIAKALDYRYISKDAIKEAMFDTESHSTWDYKWYENRAKHSLFLTLDKLVREGIDVVIESNFIGKDKERLRACLQPSSVLREVYCYAKGTTTFRRFVAKMNRAGGIKDITIVAGTPRCY